MKTLLCLFLTLTCIVTDSITAQSYTEGDTLFVVAQSGLRLRTSPSTDAGTIRILDYGDAVEIVQTFGFDEAHTSTSGWLTGHWVLVRANHAEGYLFDAYLTELALPDHEDELCFEPFRFSAPLQAYFAHHYPVVSDHTGLEHREDVDQCVMSLAGNVGMTITQGNGWYKTDVLFEGYRISEVVNLLRSMCVGSEMLQAFEDSMTFHTDSTGRVSRIRAGSREYPVTIMRTGDDAIEISMTELIAG